MNDSVAQPHLHSHNPLAEPRPHKTLPSCEIKVEACHHVIGWLGEVKPVLIYELDISYICSVGFSIRAVYYTRSPHHPSSNFIFTSYRQPADTSQMPLFWSKGFGGRRAGGNITADRHGVHRPVFRFRCCGLNCFR